MNTLRLERRHRLLARVRLYAALAALLLGASGCITSGIERPKPVKVPEIVAMSKAGVPADEIIRKMKASGTIYRLKASQLAELSREGVPPAVLDYMQQTYLNAVRVDATYEAWQLWTPYAGYWYGGAPFGWPYEHAFLILPPAPSPRPQVAPEPAPHPQIAPAPAAAPRSDRH